VPLILRLALPSPLRRLFDYLPPKGAVEEQLRPGVRLRVPFGRREVIGVLIEVAQETEVPPDKLRKALTDALQSPEFRKKLEATGSVVASPTVDTDKYIASEIDKYRKIVQFAKIEE